MTVTTPIFAPMAPEHLAGAVALSQAEGWAHRPEDWALVLSNSRGVVGLCGDRVVATAVASPFGAVATVNMVIVADDLRGRGLGRQVMERAMGRVAAETWHLVATPEGLPLYAKLGFEPWGEVSQHQGVAEAAPGGLPEEWAVDADLQALVALDRAASGMDRGWLIEALMRGGRVLVLREGGGVVGFAALRCFGRGELAGPIVARTEEEARALLATVLAHCAGRFLRVDIPDGTGLGAVLDTHGLLPVGGGVSMSRGPAPVVPGPHRRFALASQAVG